MAYYLKWGADSGNGSTNTELLQISGIVGALESVQYTVKTNAVPRGSARYLYDIRRTANSTATGGDSGFVIQFSNGTYQVTGVSNLRINGVAAAVQDVFENYVANDVISFDEGSAPSDGTISIGARHNEVESFYGLSISQIVITDANGAHTIDMSDSGGTGTSLTSTDGALTATLYNFPVDNSQWVFFYGDPPTVAPTNLSGSITGTQADLTWSAIPDNDEGYVVEFREKQ